MISHRCRYKGRGSVLMRFFTSSIDRCAAARVILAIPSLFWFQSSPPLFYHSTRIGINHYVTMTFGIVQTQEIDIKEIKSILSEHTLALAQMQEIDIKEIKSILSEYTS